MREEVDRRVAQEVEWQRIPQQAATIPATAVADPVPALAVTEQPVVAIAIADPSSPVVARATAVVGDDDQVAKWLESLGLSQYREKFAACGFDTLLSIRMLDNEDLDSMGITAQGHRRVLLAAATKTK